MIYNIVPFEIFVWSYRTSDMYFIWDIAKIPYIKKNQYPFSVNRTTGTPWDHVFFYKNDHTHIEDYDEEYYALEMAKKSCLGCTGEVWKQNTVYIRYMWYVIPTYVLPVHRHTMENQHKNVDTHQY